MKYDKQNTIDHYDKFGEKEWDNLIKNEIEFTKYPGTLDCGMNIIYVIQKL